MSLVPLFVSLAMAPGAFGATGAPEFAGVWVSSICPAGAQGDAGKCATLVLEVQEQEGRLCGSHMYATAGAASVDEGAAPSFSGEVNGNTATITVVSGRGSPGVRVKGQLKKAGNALQWQRLEDPSGDYLLPASARLTRSRSKTLFAPVFEQELKAACSSLFVMAAEKARQAAPPPAAPAANSEPQTAGPQAAPASQPPSSPPSSQTQAPSPAAEPLPSQPAVQGASQPSPQTAPAATVPTPAPAPVPATPSATEGAPK